MKRQKRGMRKGKRRTGLVILLLLLLAAAGAAVWTLQGSRIRFRVQAEECLREYMAHIEKQEYKEMYDMTEAADSGSISRGDFIERNSRIYEGMETDNIKISNVKVGKVKHGEVSVSYDMSFDTVAGAVTFANTAVFVKDGDACRLRWNHDLIYPSLRSTDKIQVSVDDADRGKILDRNGRMLAGEGTAVSVGIVPGKLEDREKSLEQIAELLGTDAETIENKLSAAWVQDDSFVPVSTIPKVQQRALMEGETAGEAFKEQERQKELLNIPGVMLSDITVRTYPLAEAAAHLVGYVQEVTAEDLEEHAGEGYSAGSVIGRSGMESLYEKELKGQDGCEITIVDENGEIAEAIASVEKEDGQDITLTIDASLQEQLYEQFREDPGCSVAMNPYTGEVLALVSTPSYDNNDFISGMSEEQWTGLNEDESRPLYNRFRQVWCPGSSFKPVTAAIGLDTGVLDAGEDFGNEGLSWQKDESWGAYEVTTLHSGYPANLKNALIYSDNIYFAKLALRIGADRLTENLDRLGFGKQLPFEILMAKSQYSNTDAIENEIQLADSGYGQGQILMNPLHLAALYTAFLNDGNVLAPRLSLGEKSQADIWLPQAFSEEAVDQIMEGLSGVVNHPDGTGYAAHSVSAALAGKTGTAELKDSKDDTDGTEIGWFSVFTTEKNLEKPILLVSMVENVKGLGGSGYVVQKDKEVLDVYLGR